ncbi:MAG: aerotolerance regulator BatA [Bacteroidetes bacterium RIFOXYA12_FULL_35_11]|nr:MAG: aerotolerance regulator BatA [Bacteroidetes bacterium GWF2_35_48]OFY76738.1 MAG: aerotolerance regulator BatA [Bacteroidetes bacterium RIFOXYA12_FULL_35_11]OFY97803.1 MAG: aerotolerance regulator BatA [Bacteroidetes bacterium RIFOXYB2_FULL_35_7]OFZ06228.1 MAG: aerotolerance regulator BatA [Bacteroidetes bacterium RIFOXYC12_FULL_35_7]HBX52333.1 aerotolerance regulator BatA [Bacteroidales bacterium]
MNSVEFANPGFFYLLLVLIPMVAWYIWKQRDIHASMQISSLNGFSKAPKSYKIYFRHLLFILRIFAIIFLVFVLARPQSTNSWQDVTTEGIDIVLAMDVSGSMLAEDFKPNRLEAAKDVAKEFIEARPNDRIGLVVFSGESFTQCPLTIDHVILINLLKGIKSGMIEDGTAIGTGLANAIARIKDSDAKSRVIILMTDGVSNMGNIAPVTAAEIAKTFGIRVYTIGVGTKGLAPYPMKTPWGTTQYQNMEVEIDEPVLRDIAGLTDGKYFRATDNKTLKNIYKEIDKLEKAKINVTNYSKKKEEFLFWGLLAALMILLEILLKNTLLKNTP